MKARAIRAISSTKRKRLLYLESNIMIGGVRMKEEPSAHSRSEKKDFVMSRRSGRLMIAAPADRTVTEDGVVLVGRSAGPTMAKEAPAMAVAKPADPQRPLIKQSRSRSGGVLTR